MCGFSLFKAQFESYESKPWVVRKMSCYLYITLWVKTSGITNIKRNLIGLVWGVLRSLKNKNAVIPTTILWNKTLINTLHFISFFQAWQLQERESRAGLWGRTTAADVQRAGGLGIISVVAGWEPPQREIGAPEQNASDSSADVGRAEDCRWVDGIINVLKLLINLWRKIEQV